MAPSEPPVLKHSWENRPFDLIYFPLLFVWIYYIIRSRAVWFFTPSNPAITFGGMQGETKTEMYARLAPDLYPATLIVPANEDFNTVLGKIAGQQIRYPFVVKPDVGEAGILFRKIDSEEQLREYHRSLPSTFLVQPLITYPVEVSVFYYRLPGLPGGTITGFLHKVPMHVTGNGVSTLRQLINQHPKATAFLPDLEKAHSHHFEKILPPGEKYVFSHAANHRRGARFYNLHQEIDTRLLSVFDGISKAAGGWYYGRYDVMCRSIGDLKAGKHFCILEYNGCGAEPNHIYDSGYTLLQAYREILKHWRALYKISRINTQKGIKPWPLFKGWKFIRQARKKVKAAEEIDNNLSF